MYRLKHTLYFSVDRPAHGPTYGIQSPYWILAERPDWRQTVIETTFAQAGSLLISKINDVKNSPEPLTREQKETLITAFENYLEIHSLLRRKK